MNSADKNNSSLDSKGYPTTTLFIAVVAIGVLTGLLAFLFKRLTTWIASHFTPLISEDSVNWWIIFPPIAGIILTGIFTRYIIHTNLTHVVAQLLLHLRDDNYRFLHDRSVSPLIGGSLTLGMGGSSGAEGPIAATGAALGSNLGYLLKLKDDDIKTLVACGAAAGIAAIFSAPVGGFMFALEVLGISLSTLPVLAVMGCALTSFLTIFTCTDFSADLYFHPEASFQLSLLPWVILLGVMCGLYSLYYSYVMNRLDSVFKKITNQWIRNLSGGLILGLILLIFPSMFSTGYPVMGHLLDDNPDALLKGSLLNLFSLGDWGVAAGAAGILLCKCWAVSATNSSGGVGGDFAPTLFAGSMAGVLFASLCSRLLGIDLPLGLFVFLGMAGIMAGAIQAPLMTVFITVEMTRSWQLFLPVTVIVFTSYAVVRWGNWADNRHFPIIRHLLWFATGHEADRHNASSAHTGARKGQQP